MEINRQVIADLVLALAGGILVFEFLIILIKGEIYPVPNFKIWAVETILILSVIALGLWGLIRGQSVREIVVNGALLMGVGGGLLTAHTIFPIFTVSAGDPINTYYGYEPNKTILITELIVFGLMALTGLANLLFDLKKMM